MSTIRLRNLDRSRPQPDVKCRVCEKTVNQLRQMKHEGKHTLGCAECYQKAQASAVDAQKPDTAVSSSDPLCQDCATPFLAKSPEHLRCDTCLVAKYEAWLAALRETAPVPEDYCRECHKPFTPKVAGQLRCDGCAEYTVAMWVFTANWRNWERWHIHPEPPTTEPESDDYDWETDPQGIFVLDLSRYQKRDQFVPYAQLSDIEREMRRRQVVEAVRAVAA
jgi:hypothetical protein